jgi:ribose transport system permease protein
VTTSQLASGQSGAVSTSARSFWRLLLDHNALIMLVVLVVVSSFLSDAFLTPGNLANLLRQLTPLMLVSMGMLLVILTGGIDLSVGSVAALGGMVVALAIGSLPLEGGAGFALAIALSALAGAAFGVLNGSLVALFGLAPFIVTLATMTIARGVVYLLTNGQPVRLPYDLSAAEMLESLGSGAVPGIGLAWPIVISLVTVVFFTWLMRTTTFGRLVIATGSNATAVRLAGLSEKRYQFVAYVISGGLAGLAGVISTSRTGVGTPSTGMGLELDGIAACVIGGALLSGGKGTVVNTLIGVLVLGLIGNVMNLLSVPVYPQQIIKGAIIIFAVLLQGVSSRKTTV